MKKIDYIVAASLAAIVVLAGFLLANPAPHPQVWCDLATAAGLRSPASAFPVLWRLLAKGTFAAFGVTGGIAVLAVIGKLTLGVMTALVYVTVQNVALGFQGNERDPLKARNIRFASAAGALCFAFSEPAWRAAQDLAPEMVFVLLMFVAMIFVLKMLLTSEFPPAVPAIFLIGALTVESPLGLLALGAFLVIYWYFGGSLSWDKPDALSDHARIRRKWQLLFSGLLGFAMVFVAALLMFVLSDGGEAHGLKGNLTQWAYYLLTDWVTRLVSGATPLGWLGVIGVSFLPGIVALWKVRLALDVERDVGFGVGVLHLLAGVLALSQLAGYAPFWAANWGVEPIVGSPLVLLLAAAFGGVVIGVASATWGVSRAVGDARGFGYQALLVAVVLLCVAGRFPSDVRDGLRALDGFVERAMREAEGCKWLVTDGRHDDALRLKIAAEKSSLRLLPFMASGAQRTELVAAMESETDSLAAGEGVPSLLNTWVRTGRAEDVCAQIGFECWKRNFKPVPPAGGVCVRTWQDEKARQAAVVDAKACGERLAAVAVEARDRVVARYVEFALWRLARIAAQRAEQAALAGDDARATDETRLVDRLDAANASAMEFRKQLREANSRMRISSPGETMKQAMERGDFGLASVYAQRLVKENPKNARAYFALGMYDVSMGQFVKAEENFNKYLEYVPDDPVVLNNRAMARLSLGKYEAALKDAEAALQKLPDVAEIKRTVECIRKAMKAAETNAVPANASSPN